MIERRRRWIEQIERDIERGWDLILTQMTWHDGKMCHSTASLVLMSRTKRLLSLLRRVRRCPECGGIGFTWEDGEKCPTCGGTGRL